MREIELIERRDGFNYDYRMKCGCGRSSLLSARDYADEINGAHMDCQHCGADVHFGPAVAAIRDEGDRTLSDELVHQMAWYHTSTWPVWPSPDFAARTAARLRESELLLGQGREQALQQLIAGALHLGTYEAAIENMLRRMHDQDDGGAQFYLYRVELRPALRLEAGYRDENVEPAAGLTVSQLETAGLDVIRYLNAYEAHGTLSLAMRQCGIAAVQQISIPVLDLVDTLNDPTCIGGEVIAAQREADQALAKLSGIPERERRLMALGIRPDPDNLAKRAEDLGRKVSQEWNVLKDALARLHLRDVSPRVSRDFICALGSWRAAADQSDPERFAGRFREMATLFTEAERVIKMLASQPRREPALPRG